MSINEKEWKVLKLKIQNRFGKLSEADLEGLKGNMDLLSSKVQKAYSFNQTKADEECKAFNKTLNSAI